MAVYQYVAAADGEAGAIRGLITADSPRQARDQLRGRGLVIRDVVEQAPAKGNSPLARYLTARQAGKVTGFLQELATLLGAGVPLLEALGTISRQHAGRFQQAILLLRDHVAAGGGLAEAMGQQPLLFDALCRNIVEVGENAGTLDVAMERLVAYRRRVSVMTNRVGSALIYPAIVLSVALLLSVFMMTFVMPQIIGVLEQSGNALPLATVIVKQVSDVLIGWWWLLMLIAAAACAAVTAVLRSDRGGLAWHRMQLRLPVLGDLIRKQAIGRLSMVLATLLKSDLPFVRAVRIARRTVGNRVLQEALEACEQAVFAGRDISQALERTQAFPPLVVQVFAVGQASGRLETMLEDLARDYDTQVEIASNRLTALLEPLMMILLAITVGFIAFATILPILEAGDVL